jgi:hypothetical protein
MQPEALFGLALGIVPPWEVTTVEFSKESRLDCYRLHHCRQTQVQFATPSIHVTRCGAAFAVWFP